MIEVFWKWIVAAQLCGCTIYKVEGTQLYLRNTTCIYMCVSMYVFIFYCRLFCYHIILKSQKFSLSSSSFQCFPQHYTSSPLKESRQYPSISLFLYWPIHFIHFKVDAFLFAEEKGDSSTSWVPIWVLIFFMYFWYL